MMRVEAARQQILAAINPLAETQMMDLRRALGRILAYDVVSPFDVPGHTNSAMDGYAFSFRDLPRDGPREYRVIGAAFAGHPFADPPGSGECVQIMTGAPMPPGTDTVVMQEQVEAVDDQRVRVGSGHRKAQNVRQAGEDIATGSKVLPAGRRLSPADLGVLASLGLGEVRVRRRPRVAFFSSGDELRSIGDALGDGEIYDSNRYSLFGMLERADAEILDMGVIRDEPQELRAAFSSAAANADVIVTTGGVSVGQADYTRQILDEMGTCNFWKIAMKPGRPLVFGRVGEALFFGLPGNPVAVMVTFYQFVQPALCYLSSGQRYQPLIVPALCRTALRKRPGRFEFQRGCLSTEEGRLCVSRTGGQGSGILTSMSRANCFILLDETCGDVAEGETVAVQPFSGLI
jgi:molybdopterin molybdotransferase